jgi:hypothetical protein
MVISRGLRVIPDGLAAGVTVAETGRLRPA